MMPRHAPPPGWPTLLVAALLAGCAPSGPAPAQDERPLPRVLPHGLPGMASDLAKP